jgi:predicted ATP-grasp superfamily ATP-dependent carboligase
VRGRRTQPGRVGAVVVGGDYQGLGIVRGLGSRGVPVCVIDDERSIARFSRYATHSVACADLRDERRTVDTVLEVGRRLGLDGWVLYPTRDETVAAFARHRPELAERFRVPTPSWEVVRRAWDKRQTYAWAEQIGIPVPRTSYPVDARELAEVGGTPPFVIKPAIKEHFIYATKSKAWKARTTDELRTMFDAAAGIVGPGEVMIQELIPGGGEQQFAYCAFFKDQRPVAKMVVQRARQHPPEFGRASTFVQTVDVPALETLAERFLRSIDYYGLAELEFKLDPRDGQYKLLDVNARTWGYHTLGARAGVDFPYLVYADQAGQRQWVERRRATPGVRWIRLATDLPTAAVELAHGRLDSRAYVRSLRQSNVESVFSRRDPLPGLMECLLLPYLAMKRGF